MDPRGYCATCNNTGYIDCHCGGDLCVCGEEEIDCPECGGMDIDDDEDLLEELLDGQSNEAVRTAAAPQVV